MSTYLPAKAGWAPGCAPRLTLGGEDRAYCTMSGRTPLLKKLLSLFANARVFFSDEISNFFA